MNAFDIITGYKKPTLNSKICFCEKNTTTPRSCDFSLHNRTATSACEQLCEVWTRALCRFQCTLTRQLQSLNVCTQRAAESRTHDMWSNNILIYNLLLTAALLKDPL